KEVKKTSEYKTGKRLEDLERYITQFLKEKKPDTVFAATLEKVGMDSIENTLHAMINRAEMEIVLVTPWIKEGIWERVQGKVLEFVKNGGELKVFIKGTKEDFSSGRSDYSVVKEIGKYGGVVKFVPKLHAKVYVVDQREALICSANLSRSGLDFSYEAGVWTCNPGIVSEVGKFVDRLGS
ncbi:MAG: phospholipase D family protein, partial [Proteobacteria bacterium]|nr:phospholipase D family protein [Pseudomonadota bacterium]